MINVFNLTLFVTDCIIYLKTEYELSFVIYDAII